MALVDTSLLQAYQSAMAPFRQSRSGLIDSIGGAVGDVGESLVRRRGEMQDTRRNLRDYEQALKIESAGLEDERSKLMDFIAKGPPSEREQAVADAQLRSIDKRLGEIGRVGETVPQNIGESVTYRNFRDVRPAILGKREDYTPDAALQSISAREQSEAMAAKEAQRQQERDQDLALRNRQIAAQEERNRGMMELAKERANIADQERQRKLSILPTKDQDQLDAGSKLLDQIEYSRNIIEKNKQFIPMATRGQQERQEMRKEGSLAKDFLASAGEAFTFTEPETQEEIQAVDEVLMAINSVSAEKINELYGAVLTPQELSKASTFMPSAGDSYEKLVSNLNGLESIARIGQERLLARAKAQGYNIEPQLIGMGRKSISNSEQPVQGQLDIDSLLQSGEWEIVPE